MRVYSQAWEDELKAKETMVTKIMALAASYQEQYNRRPDTIVLSLEEYEVIRKIALRYVSQPSGEEVEKICGMNIKINC
jgi:hypothetical protein